MKGLFSTKAVWPTPRNGEHKKGRQLAVAMTLITPAAIVLAFLFLLTSLQGGIEARMANLARALPSGYAFAAGMVASVNPCGILLLSSYAMYQARAEGPPVRRANLALRTLLISIVMTLSFVVVFAAVGWIVTAGGRWLAQAFPYAGLGIGLLMIGLGAWLLLSHKTLGIPAGKSLTVGRQHSVSNAFLFGLTYAVASLSCTLPVFLVVVGSVLAGSGSPSSFVQFVSYAFGMGLVVLAVTMGGALFRRTTARWLRFLTPHIHRLSAMFLLGAGIYLVYYWLVLGGIA